MGCILSKKNRVIEPQRNAPEPYPVEPPRPQSQHHPITEAQYISEGHQNS